MSGARCRAAWPQGAGRCLRQAGLRAGLDHRGADDPGELPLGHAPPRRLQGAVDAGLRQARGPLEDLDLLRQLARADPAGPSGRVDDLDRAGERGPYGVPLGAEAVDVNGHRLGSTTSIRFAGEALVVAHRPLARPYVVSAVGGPAVRQSAREGAIARRLAEVGHRRNVRTQVREEGHLHLPAAAVLTPRSARPDPAASHPSAPEPMKVVP